LAAAGSNRRGWYDDLAGDRTIGGSPQALVLLGTQEAQEYRCRVLMRCVDARD
jgi:hypothetical protein